MRLTNTTREAIIETVVRKGTAKKEAKLIEDYRALVQKVVDERLPKNIRDWMDDMPKTDLVPFSTRSDFGIKNCRPALATRRGAIDADGVINIARPVLILPSENYYHRHLDPQPKHNPRLKRILSAMTALVEKKKEIRSTVTQAVMSCNTAKQLIESYPPLAEFIPNVTTANLPAIPAEQVAKVVADAKKAA